MSDMDDRGARLARSWDANAGSWTDAVRSRALESRRLATDDAIMAEVLACGGRRVLDVGCGEGWLARRLAAQGRDVVGFDGSAALIDAALAAGGATFLRLSYGDFARDPHLPGDDFDVAVCNFSLLGEDVRAVLRALRTITTGHLLVQTLHPLGSGVEPYVDGWREETFTGVPGEWQPMPWYHRTIGTWIGEIRAAGWSLEACREPLHPSSGLPLSLILRARTH